MTYENIILKKHEVPKKGGVGNVELHSVIDPFLKSIMDKLALKYPQWVFEEKHSQRHVTTDDGWGVNAYAFTIKDKREELGSIEKDWTIKGHRFLVRNHRIDAMRERGCGMKTIHEDKALKYVDKFFSRKSMTEKVGEARLALREKLNDVAYDKSRNLERLWNNFTQVAQSFIVANFDEFKKLIPSTELATIEGLPSLVEEDLIITSMKVRGLSTIHGDAYFVYIDGIDYAVTKANDDGKLEIKSSEELPEFLRKGIGMLKLVEDGVAIGNIGFRCNATTFLVLDPNKC
jgi:hypothetical protein